MSKLRLMSFGVTGRPDPSRPHPRRSHLSTGVPAAAVRLILALCVMVLAAYGAAVPRTAHAVAQTPPAASAVSIPATRAAKNLAILTLDTGDQPIEWVTAYSIKRRIKLAEEAGADAMVIRIHTPGGELGAVLEICQAIKESSIKNSVAWINTKAYSGGAVIALACREIVLTDNATFGDAAVIAVSARGLETLGPTERAKVLAPLLTEVVDSARRGGYDEKLVQGFVTLGVQLWLVENVVTGQRICIDAKEYEYLFGSAPPPGTPILASAPDSVINAPVKAPDPNEERSIFDSSKRKKRRGGSGVAPASPAESLGPASEAADKLVPASPQISPELAATVSDGLTQPSARPALTKADIGQWKEIGYISDGNTIYTMKTGEVMKFGLGAARINTEQEMAAYFGAVNVRTLDPAWSEAFVRLLTNRIVQGILIVIFLIALFLEMTHPGLVLPGTVAGLALLALLGPPILIGAAAWWEVAAILAGVVLIAIELFLLPGFGVFGVLGIVCLFGGLLGAMVPTGSSGMFPGSAGENSVLYSAAILAVSTIIAGVGAFFITKNLRSLPVFGRLVLAHQIGESAEVVEAAESVGPAVGQVGRAITPLRPSGKAQFGDEVVDVVAAGGFVDSGVPVRVVEAQAFKLTVEAVIGPLPTDLGPSNVQSQSSQIRPRPDNTHGGVA